MDQGVVNVRAYLNGIEWSSYEREEKYRLLNILNKTDFWKWN